MLSAGANVREPTMALTQAESFTQASIDDPAPVTWPRWKLRAVRVTFVLVAFATVHLLPGLTRYLYVEPVVRAVNVFVRPVSFAVVDALLATGALILGGGDTTVIENPQPRYGTRAVVTAAAYLLGLVLVSAAITTVWSAVDKR